MKKRVLALIMAMSMVFALCACGAEKEPEQDNQPSQSQPVESKPVDNEPDDNQPGEATKTDTLKIGLLTHQTGWFAGVDTPNYNEFNAMIAYVNDNLGGWTVGDTTYTLEAVCVDGASDYAVLNTAALALVDAGVDFVVETNDFWVNTVAPVFEEEGIMHVSAYCVLAPGYIVPENPLAFTGGNGAAGDYATAFAALNEYYPDVKTVVMCENDNGNIDITYPVVQAAAAEYGITVLDPIIYPGDTTDYTTVANQIVATGADCFLGAGAPDAYGAILKAVRAQGSDMVCACCQGKPATTLMEYAGAEASSNAFTLGPSTRESDKGMNPDILNEIIAKVAELYGQETADTFDGAAANCLYILLQMMQRSGSVVPETVAAEWAKGGTVDTIYGTGTIGGETTYGVANHAMGSPRSVSIIDPTAEGGWFFGGWVDTLIP